MKKLAAGLFAMALWALSPADVFATPEPTDPASTTTTTTPLPSGPLIPVPAGCEGPTEAALVFEGVLLAKDARTGRFLVHQVRAGSSAGYEISGLIDVRLGDDVRFLNENETYVVGAAPLGPNLPLGSNVRAGKPIFGGNAVIGLDESSLECPTFEDPLQVLHLDGTPIDTGVLTGLTSAKGKVARAVLTPVLAAFAILLGLALVRWFFTGMFRFATQAANEDVVRPRRDRTHGLADDAL